MTSALTEEELNELAEDGRWAKGKGAPVIYIRTDQYNRLIALARLGLTNREEMYLGTHETGENFPIGKGASQGWKEPDPCCEVCNYPINMHDGEKPCAIPLPSEGERSEPVPAGEGWFLIRSEDGRSLWQNEDGAQEWFLHADTNNCTRHQYETGGLTCVHCGKQRFNNTPSPQGKEIGELVTRLRAGRLVQHVMPDSGEIRCDDTLYLEAAAALEQMEKRERTLFNTVQVTKGGYQNQIAELQSTIAALRDENKRLREAMERFAQGGGWTQDMMIAHARAALSGKPQGGN